VPGGRLVVRFGGGLVVRFGGRRMTARSVRVRARLPVLVAGGVGATIVAGEVARRLDDHVGTPLAPFMASIDPRATLLAPFVVVLFGLAVVAAPRLLGSAAGPRGFAAGALALSLALRLALALGRGGLGQWDAVFARSDEAPHEYLPALPALRIGVHAFLERFPRIAPTLPTHAAGHPPGMLVTLDLLGITSPAGMAALTIGVGALSVPLTYVLGRSLVDESRARIATLLVGFSPSVLIIGVSSADALYATLGLAAACALFAARPAFRALGPAVLAMASFFSPALLAIGFWAVIVRVLRGERAAAVRAALACGCGIVAFYVALRLLTGFDPVATIRAIDADYRRGIAGGRPYWFWLFGSPAAFLVALGIPVAWLAVRALGRGDPSSRGLALVIVISSVLGYTKAETERIWVFLVPLACLAAATELPPRRLRLVLAGLAVQALLAELLLNTVW
jgi:methylthioxylose transferase